MNKRKMLAMGLLGGDGITVPRYGLVSPGTLLDDFETAANWTVVAGTVAANTTPGEFRTGTQSLKLTTDVGAKVEINKTISRVFGSAPRLRFSFYHHGTYDITKFSSFRVYIYSGANNFTFTITAGSVYTANVHEGWVTLETQPSGWTNAGNNWANVQDKIIIRLTPTATNQLEWSFDEMWLNPIMKTSVMFTFDDASPSVYDYAYTYMRSRNKKGTFYVITGDVSGGTTISVAELTEMYASGWSIGNHTSDHTNLTTITQAEVTIKLSDAKTALDGWGFTRSSMHCAYPLGAYNDVVRAGAVDAGIITGRHTSAVNVPTFSADQNYQIGVSASLSSTVTIADAKTIIDNAIAGGTMVIFYGHVLASSAGSSIWAIDDFYALVDYCISKGLPFLTINDLYAMQSGSVKIK